jgi:hypothetical protein
MITVRENAGFVAEILDSSDWLEKAIEWIKGKYSPEDVFDESQLATWATENGYVLEEE